MVTLVGSLGVALTACASRSPSNSQPPKSDLEDQEIRFWQNRKKLVKESELYKIFETSVRPLKDQFEVFQVVCDQGATGSRCSFQSKNSPKTMRLNSESSGQLLSLLVNLPLNKGETGVSVDYISCRRYKEADPSPWRYHCSVAAPVGMIPHTSLPISELPD